MDAENVLKELNGASAMMGILPEQPGTNGSVLLIDDTEAERIEKAIDAGIELLKLQQGRASADPQEFKDAAAPLVQYLSRYSNPHMTVIVTGSGAELLAGECTANG